MYFWTVQIVYMYLIEYRKTQKRYDRVIRHDLLLKIFRNQFSLFKEFNYFRMLIFIPAERADCWEHLDTISF